MATVDVERDVKGFLVDKFLLGRSESLGDDDSLLGNVIDSSGSIELVMFLQQHFGITIDDDELLVPGNFDSVKSIATYVSRKLDEKPK
jgi:acyl carrier protein